MWTKKGAYIMAKIAEGIHFVAGQDEFIPDSHVYVIGEPGSNDLSMIDVGLTGKGSYKVQSIKKMGIEPSSIKRIIMTHTHLDHIGCFAEVQKQIPGVELWGAHERSRASRKRRGRRRIWNEGIQRHVPDAIRAQARGFYIQGGPQAGRRRDIEPGEYVMGSHPYPRTFLRGESPFTIVPLKR